MIDLCRYCGLSRCADADTDWQCRAARDVSELAAQLAEARAVIHEHNTGCDSACESMGNSGRCNDYRIRQRECPDCPKDWRIEYEALAGGE